MLNTTAGAGVCPACRFDADCIYASAARRVILQCEQFELAMPTVRHASPDTRTAAAEHRKGKLAGLCSNCEFADTCIYPKPEGGVWRCEEYR